MKNQRYPYFPLLLISSGIPKPVEEHRFHQTRRWEFDFAFPDRLLAVEIDGGIWTDGRHTRGSGRLGDMEKQNAAACLGWRILYFTPQQIRTLATIETIKQALAYQPPCT